MKIWDIDPVSFVLGVLTGFIAYWAYGCLNGL
jgi:hypothetical protein